MTNRLALIYSGWLSAPILNNHLHSALLVKLKGRAADYAVSRRDLHGDGVGLLEALRLSYRNILTPSDLILLNQKFQSHSRPKTQPIESFATELEIMYNIILDHGGHATKADLKQYFIYNFGPDISQISNLQNMGTLPPEWQPLELHELIPVAKKYLKSVLSTWNRNRVYKETHNPPSAPSAPR